jgi:L-2-hydroxyglutarate oxidase LhgO
MYERVKSKDHFVFDTKVTKIASSENGTYLLMDSHLKPIVEADTVIICSGAASSLRCEIPN